MYFSVIYKSFYNLYGMYARGWVIVSGTDEPTMSATTLEKLKSPVIYNSTIEWSCLGLWDAHIYECI